MLFPVLQGVSAKVLLALSRVSYHRCSPAMARTILSVPPHHMTPCALLSWVWSSIVEQWFLGQSWRNPAQRCFTLLPFSPISCFAQRGTSLGLGTTEKLYVRAKQMLLQVPGQPVLWPDA